MLMTLVSCTSEDGGGASAVTAPTSIGFTTYVNSVATRATYPSVNTTPTIGAIDSDRLKTTAFGVFAQHTSETAWTGYDKSTPFNFMWNQQVTWDDENSSWTYSPVKYWPNDNKPADDQTPASQGSLEHSYLSFFAYAPYVEGTDLPATGHSDAKADGIVEMSTNNTNINNSYIYYRTSNNSPFDADESVDLLWATNRDCYKTDAAGYGYVNGTVNLLFKHALSLFTVTVQGLFDHANNDDTTAPYPTDRDIFTKILVESVDFSGSPVFKEGKMYIAPSPATADVPHWDMTAGKEYSLIVDGEEVNPTFANRYLDGTWKKYWDESDIGVSVPENLKSFLQLSDQDDDGDVDADDALVLYNQLPKGVSHTEVPLNYTNYDTEAGKYEDYYYMVLPNDEYRTSHPTEKMTVRMVYYVITYDERLTLVKTGYPKYFSIVKNDITAVFDNFSFAPNKKYKLRLQPGLTSAKFEVTMVDDWDTPLTLDPEVVDWYETPIEYNVE